MSAVLAWSLRLAREQTLGLARDIPGERSCDQAGPDEHHPVWTLGHLVLADSYLLTLLDAGKLPPDFPDLLARYGPGAVPTADAGSYDAFASLQQRLTALGDLRATAVATMGDAALARATPDPVLARTQPTIGHHLHALLCHEGYHAGKLSAWRRAHGFASARWAFAE